MSSSGSISAMITSLKNNEAILKRRGYFNKRLQYQKVLSAHNLEFKSASKEELAIVRHQMLRNLRREKMERIAVYIVIVTLLVAVMVWILFS